ncbi:SUMF1/EgtB/PvdO family nonheme iron enzyme, partial [Pseudotamlana agarivorans]|uniref:SUMF1/EgtB/PvdO family nonheme iron enzyme n=1 Tax=Pseudotamlana agarivorans TaxID=481183 RepID=UPI0014725097
GILSISDTFSFTTIRENTLPTIPNLLSPVNGLTDVNAKPTLSWSKSIDADNDPITYRVFFKEDHPGSDFSFLTETTETSYTISTTLKDYTSYIWYIKAIDGYEGANASVSSNTASFIVENYQNDAPTAFSLSTPQDNATNRGFHVNLSWNASSDADGESITYDVYADANSNPQTLIASNISKTTFLHTFNTYGEIYWKVVAKDNFGHETTSNIWSFTCWKNSPIEQPEMINVEGGAFTMGQSELTQIQIGVLINGDPLYMDISNENPAHQITLSDYNIGKYEVTNTQYVAFLNSILDDIVIQPTDFKAHRRESFYYRRASYKGELALCQIFDATRDLSTRANIDYEPRHDSPIIWNGTSFELDENYADHPIRWMYYTGAKLYGEWLGNYRIPTEAEWEYAAFG